MIRTYTKLKARLVLIVSVLFAALVPALFLPGCSTIKGDIEVDLGLAEKTYISPGVADGVQDTLIIPMSVLPATPIIVTGYQFSVFDSTGRSVIGSQVGSGPLLPGRGAPQAKAVEIPKELIWDGRDEEGELVADGEYTYQIEAWDNKGNMGKSRPLIVVVDNLPPSLLLSVSSPIFSPNGDGKLDTLTIYQRNSTEELKWSGVLLNSSGGTVRGFEWEGAAGDFDWDGKDESGASSADGTYSYVIRSQDLGGNSFEAGLSDIALDTRKSTVLLEIEYPSFSPNGDGIRDLVRFLPKLSVTENTESWTLDIYDATGAVHRSLTGSGSVGRSIDFNGKDDEGNILPDGAYRGVLGVLYRTGDNPQGVSPEFTLDTTLPFARLNSDTAVFSPDGDGLKDTVTINQSSSVEARWEGAIIDGTGRPVKQFSFQERALPVTWDGKDGSGKVVPDGTYTYRLTSTDEAGNTGKAEIKEIRVDTRPTPVSVSAGAKGFSPNGDGIKDFVVFTPQLSIRDGIRSWSLAMVNAEGKPERTFKGEREAPPATLSWDGKGETGAVKEGPYYALFSVEYEKGNKPQSRSAGTFLLDISPPSAGVKITPRPFSPDGDGVAEKVTVSMSVTDKSPVESWSAGILDPTGQAFIGFAGTGAPLKPIIWNGRSAKGELVQSAEDYPFVLTVKDDLGNKGSVRQNIEVDILVMKFGDKLKIIISSIVFKPYTADYMSIPADRAQRNIKTLDRLAEVLKKYGGYRIVIEGHAVREYWNIPNRIEKEEEEELIPLSRDRAEIIKNALVDRGIGADRMSTAWYGGTQPVVPHSDHANHWKNRRVEFILIKQ